MNLLARLLTGYSDVRVCSYIGSYMNYTIKYTLPSMLIMLLAASNLVGSGLAISFGTVEEAVEVAAMSKNIKSPNIKTVAIHLVKPVFA